MELNSFPKKISIIGRPRKEVFPNPAVNTKHPKVLESIRENFFRTNRIVKINRNKIQAIPAGNKNSAEKLMFRV